MNWRELVEKTANNSGLSKAVVDRVLGAFVDVAGEAITAPGSVRLKSIGTLSAEWRGGRVLRSPQDHKRMFLDGRFQPVFRPAEAVKRGLATRSPQLWRDAEHQGAWRLAETLLSDLELYHPDKVPRALGAKQSDDEVMAACEAAFGVHWRRVVSAWDTGASETVRKTRNHLAYCAKLRWGAQRS